MALFLSFWLLEEPGRRRPSLLQLPMAKTQPFALIRQLPFQGYHQMRKLRNAKEMGKGWLLLRPVAEKGGGVAMEWAASSHNIISQSRMPTTLPFAVVEIATLIQLGDAPASKCQGSRREAAFAALDCKKGGGSRCIHHTSTEPPHPPASSLVHPPHPTASLSPTTLRSQPRLQATCLRQTKKSKKTTS